MSTPLGQLGGYQYQSPEVRRLGGITPQSYDYRDQAKTISKLVNDVSYMAGMQRKMQKGIDDANQNAIQQIQSLLNDLLVILGGGGDLGFDWGDTKYLFQAIGALFGLKPGSGIPINLFDAAWHFFSTYIFPVENFEEVINMIIDGAIASLLDIFGEVPIVGQALQQFAQIISSLRDILLPVANAFEALLHAFNLNTGDLEDIEDYFGVFKPIWEAISSALEGVSLPDFVPVFNMLASFSQPFVNMLVAAINGVAVFIRLITGQADAGDLNEVIKSLSLLADPTAGNGTGLAPIDIGVGLITHLLSPTGLLGDLNWADLAAQLFGVSGITDALGFGDLASKFFSIFGDFDLGDEGFNPFSLWTTVIDQIFQPLGGLVTQQDLVGLPSGRGLPYSLPFTLQKVNTNPQVLFFNNLRKLFPGANFFSNGFDPFSVISMFIEQMLKPAGLLAPLEQLIKQLLAIFKLGSVGDIFGDILSLATGFNTWFGDTKNTASGVTSLFSNFSNLVENLFGGLTNTTPGSSGLNLGGIIGSLFNIIQQIPPVNVGGVGGFGSIFSTITGLFNNLVGGFVGKPGTGATASDVFNIAQIISSWASNGNSALNILNIRDNNSLLSGFISGTISNLNLDTLLLRATTPLVDITQSTALTSYIRIPKEIATNVISWQGFGKTNVTSLVVNLWKMAQNTGVKTLIHTSTNLISMVGTATTPQHMVYPMPNIANLLPNEIIGVELAVTGTGKHTVLGDTVTMAEQQVFPRKLSSVRNSNAETTPPATDSSVTYTNKVAFVELGVNTGTIASPVPPANVNVRSPETKFFNTAGNFSISAPTWVKKVVAIVLSGAGSGRFAAEYGTRGAGGTAPVWNAKEFIRDKDFNNSSNTFALNVGSGGQGSGDGSSSDFYSPLGGSVASTIGRGAKGLDATGTDYIGKGPGDFEYDGVFYRGGAPQQNLGGDGAAPGGAGAGGGQVAYQSGGKGADGVVIVIFKAA